tara:strand:- start:841 stop:1182 length:342 start_codon:yes stop_codon:yes gene_type:complete
MYKFKKESKQRFRPKGSKPAAFYPHDKAPGGNILEPNVEEQWELPWNSYEWGKKDKRFGKKAKYKTASFKNRFVSIIDIDERTRNNRREIVYTICDGEEVKRIPGKFLRDFCL